MTASINVDVDRFWRDGYLVLKGFFPRDTAETLRRLVYQSLEDAKQQGRTRTNGSVTYIKGDLLSLPRISTLVYHEGILAVARELLGGQPVYFGDSNLEIGSGVRGWHKDNRLADRFDPDAPDWQGRYTLIRFGIYLQDHARHGGPLALRVGSHNVVDLRVGKAVFVDTEPGDLAVWSLRITHSGNAVRTWLWPTRKFDTPIEQRIPAWLRIPEERERVAIFLTYGAHDEHTRRYMEYFRERDYGREWLLSSRFGPEVWEQLRDRDVEVIRPIPEYGTMDDADVPAAGART